MKTHTGGVVPIMNQYDRKLQERHTLHSDSHCFLWLTASLSRAWRSLTCANWFRNGSLFAGYRRFETSAFLYTSHLLEETLKANGPFYQVSMPGEVKDPTYGVNV